MDKDTKTITITIRTTPKIRRIWAKVAQAHGLNLTTLPEMLVLREARRLGIKDDEDDEKEGNA